MDKEIDIPRATISYGKDGIRLSIGNGYYDPDLFYLDGFDSSWDAWAFYVAHTGICSLRVNGIPESVMEWTHNPPELPDIDSLIQSSMF